MKRGPEFHRIGTHDLGRALLRISDHQVIGFTCGWLSIPWDRRQLSRGEDSPTNVGRAAAPQGVGTVTSSPTVASFDYTDEVWGCGQEVPHAAHAYPVIFWTGLSEVRQCEGVDA